MSQKYQVDLEEFEEIKKLGFVVDKKAKDHYRIRKVEGGRHIIEVYPASRKYCVSYGGDFGSALPYRDLVAVVKSHLTP